MCIVFLIDTDFLDSTNTIMLSYKDGLFGFFIDACCLLKHGFLCLIDAPKLIIALSIPGISKLFIWFMVPRTIHLLLTCGVVHNLTSSSIL